MSAAGATAFSFLALSLRPAKILHFDMTTLRHDGPVGGGLHSVLGAPVAAATISNCR
jgi:hypothetical protein